jgi:hypothetical protein
MLSVTFSAAGAEEVGGGVELAVDGAGVDPPVDGELPPEDEGPAPLLDDEQAAARSAPATIVAVPSRLPRERVGRAKRAIWSP